MSTTPLHTLRTSTHPHTCTPRAKAPDRLETRDHLRTVQTTSDMGLEDAQMIVESLNTLHTHPQIHTLHKSTPAGRVRHGPRGRADDCREHGGDGRRAHVLHGRRHPARCSVRQGAFAAFLSSKGSLKGLVKGDPKSLFPTKLMHICVGALMPGACMPACAHAAWATASRSWGAVRVCVCVGCMIAVLLFPKSPTPPEMMHALCAVM